MGHGYRATTAGVPSRQRASGISRVVMSAYQLVRGAIPSQLRDALRRRMLSVPAGEVVRVLDALDRAGIGAIVLGGWGVDALMEQQTRKHRDLDLVVDEPDWPKRSDKVMHSLGYCFLHDEFVPAAISPRRRVWQDLRGRTVDLHPAVGELTTPGCAVDGVIGGRRVRCLTPELQLSARKGHAVRAEDLHDVRQLSLRFRLPMAVGNGTDADCSH